MEQKILIAFDESENAMRAVLHVAKFYNTKSNITLLSVLPDLSTLYEMSSPELTPYFKTQQSNFLLIQDKKKEVVRDALKKARAALIEAGFDESKITTKLATKQRGIARDILDEARQGYDLIVLGRRGISGIKEFFLGSVSQKVFSQAKDISVLIVN
jgi:nucleotide-binding universal stress UspA family protein